MAIVSMKRMTFLGLKKDREEIIKRLMSLGVVEISGHHDIVEETEAEESAAEVSETVSPVVRELIQKHAAIQSAIDQLTPYDMRKKGLFAVRRTVSAQLFQQTMDHQQVLWDTIAEIESCSTQLVSLQSESNRLLHASAALSYWIDYPYDLSVTETANTRLLLGTVSSEESFSQLHSLCQEQGLLCEMEKVRSGKDAVWCYLLYHIADENTILDVLRRFGWNRADLSGYQGTVSSNIQALEQNQQEISEQMEGLRARLSELAQQLPELELLSDGYLIERDKQLAVEKMSQTRSTFAFEGWVPAKSAAEIESLSDLYTCHIVFCDPADNEIPPTLLDNGPIGRTVESIVTMYGTPAYSEADPCSVGGLFYILFFGLMLSDAGYGLLVSLLCGIILKTKKLERGTKQFLTLFFYCGLSTMFWGILFGGWFGDAVSVLTNGRVSVPVLWFDPVSDPERLLAYSLLFGVIHVFVGYGMKAWNYIREKRYLDVLFDVVFWYVFYLGEVFFLLPYVPSVNPEIAAQLAPWGMKLLLVGFVLIFFTRGRKEKNLFKKVVSGVGALYSLVDMLSDVLSYSRLMALGLATSVIINVFNSIGMMAGYSVQGFILFTLVFLAANAFNLAINLLGTYVNAMRLMYIEFFGKFYEGTGREFQPLAPETEYVVVEPSAAEDAKKISEKAA